MALVMLAMTTLSMIRDEQEKAFARLCGRKDVVRIFIGVDALCNY